MSNSYPIESLLRPPVEWWGTVIFITTAILLLLFPSYFLVFKNLSYGLAALFLLVGIHRFFQGYRVYRYQRNLRRLSRYTMSSNDLPVSEKKLFLGKGFKWEAIHTQRLRDLKKSEQMKYLKPGKCYQWARQLDLSLEHKKDWQWLRRLLSSQSPLNPVRPLPDVGGLPALHGVEPKEQKVLMNLSERVGHTLVVGTTRVGKTRFAELLSAQDIRRGETVIVFDPKGDADLLRRMFYECQQAGRLEDLIVFHLGFPEVSARYNPIGNFARITEVANRVANQLPSSGESAAFKEFAWRFVNIIAGALVALGQKPSYKLLNQYILNIDPLLLQYCQQLLPGVDVGWESKVNSLEAAIDEKTLPFHLKNRSRKMIALMRYVQSLNIEDDTLKGLCAIFDYDQTYYQKITASLSPLLEKLTTGRVAELISPDYEDLNDERPIFDWLQVIRGKKVVYVGLDALSDTTVAAAVGNSMFADLCSVAGQLYKFGVGENISKPEAEKSFHKINIHADEFNELIGDEFVPLLNKAGGAGVQVTAYTQTIPDIEARLGSQAKTGQVLGNLNTIVSLRVLDASTAQFFVNKLAQRVQVKDVVHASGVNDAATLGSEAHFTTHQSDQVHVSDVPMLSADDLLQLPKGQAFCLLEGGQLWKIRMPLPKDDMSDIPENIEVMTKKMGNIHDESREHEIKGEAEKVEKAEITETIETAETTKTVDEEI